MALPILRNSFGPRISARGTSELTSYLATSSRNVYLPSVWMAVYGFEVLKIHTTPLLYCNLFSFSRLGFDELWRFLEFPVRTCPHLGNRFHRAVYQIACLQVSCIIRLMAQSYVTSICTFSTPTNTINLYYMASSIGGYQLHPNLQPWSRVNES